MARGLRRLANLTLARGWNAWLEAADERAAFLLQLRKGVSFLVNRKLALSMASWRDVSDTKLKRAARYLMNRTLARGWGAWHGLWSEHRRKVALLKRSGNMFAKPKLTAAWSHWQKSWEHEAASRAAMTLEQQLAHEESARREAEGALSKATAELAEAMIAQSDPAGGQAAAAPIGTPGGALHAGMLSEQARLVREALAAFGHHERKAALPVGTLEECLA